MEATYLFVRGAEATVVENNRGWRSTRVPFGAFRIVVLDDWIIPRDEREQRGITWARISGKVENG